MSILIDTVVYNHTPVTEKAMGNDGKWYIAKSMVFVSFREFISRFGDAWRVITGKSFAVHYKVDEKNEKENAYSKHYNDEDEIAYRRFKDKIKQQTIR